MISLKDMPAEVIAYHAKSIEPLSRGLRPLLLPPLNVTVKGSKYDCICTGDGITTIIAHADSDHQMIAGRRTIVTDQIGKSAREVDRKKRQIGTAKQQAAKAGIDTRPYLESVVVERQAELVAAETEMARLVAVRDDCTSQLADWKPQETRRFLYRDVEGAHFNLVESGDLETNPETPLERVKNRVRSGDVYAISELRLIMPAEPLTIDQCQAFLIEKVKEDKHAVNVLMQAVVEVRNASKGVPLSGVSDTDSKSGGSDDQGGSAEPVPAVPGAGGKAGLDVQPTVQQPAIVGSVKGAGRKGR